MRVTHRWHAVAVILIQMLFGGPAVASGGLAARTPLPRELESRQSAMARRGGEQSGFGPWLRPNSVGRRLGPPILVTSHPAVQGHCGVARACGQFPIRPPRDAFASRMSEYPHQPVIEPHRQHRAVLLASRRACTMQGHHNGKSLHRDGRQASGVVST
jgi:hypothetical protein